MHLATSLQPSLFHTGAINIESIFSYYIFTVGSSQAAIHLSQLQERMIRLKVLLAWLPVLLAAGWFAIRGPLRARTDYVNDFASPYVSARLWMAHQNPYALSAFFPTWHAAGAPLGSVYANPSNIRSVYPPSSIVAVIPFALLPWPVASKALLLLSAGLYATALILLASFVPGDWSQTPQTSLPHIRSRSRPGSLRHPRLERRLPRRQPSLHRHLPHTASPGVLDRNSATTAFIAALIAYSLCLNPPSRPSSLSISSGPGYGELSLSLSTTAWLSAPSLSTLCFSEVRIGSSICEITFTSATPAAQSTSLRQTSPASIASTSRFLSTPSPKAAPPPSSWLFSSLQPSSPSGSESPQPIFASQIASSTQTSIYSA